MSRVCKRSVAVDCYRHLVAFSVKHGARWLDNFSTATGTGRDPKGSHIALELGQRPFCTELLML